MASSVDELLAIARADFAGRLPAKVDELERLASSEVWPELRVAAHKLRGSAATYGFPALGALAAAVEDLILEGGGSPGAAAGRLHATLAEARAEAARASREGR